MRRPDWRLVPNSLKGTIFLLSLVLAASMMPVEKLPPASWQTALGLGFISAVFDNIPLTALALKQGGYDWGFLAYAVGFGGSMIWFGSSAGVALVEHVLRGAIGRTMAAARLACRRRLRGRFLRDALPHRFSSGHGSEGQRRPACAAAQSTVNFPTRQRVVVSRRIFPELVDVLRADFDVVDNQADTAWTASDLARALRDADGALLTAGDRVDEALLASDARA